MDEFRSSYKHKIPDILQPHYHGVAYLIWLRRFVQPFRLLRVYHRTVESREKENKPTKWQIYV